MDDTDGLWLVQRRTPAGVAQLMVELLGIREGMTVYDPVCGSAGLLIQAANYLRDAGGDVRTLSLYGQEKDARAFRFACQRLHCEGLLATGVAGGDTLRTPQHPDASGRLRRFDAVLANPPFSLMDWGQEEWLYGNHFGRDVYGYPPPSNGDYAFVLHVVASLEEGGRAVMVLPNGVLYRSRAEGRIREALLRDDLVDAVIGLGPKLFMDTSTPAVLLVLHRGRATPRRGRVLLVDGTSAFVPRRRQNTLSEKHVARLTEATRRYSNQEGLCRVVSMDEIAANDFNLSLGRYLRAESASEPDARARTAARRVALEAELAAARTALEQAQSLKVQCAGELFTRGASSATTWFNEVGELPMNWELSPLSRLLEEPPRNGIYLRWGDVDESILQVGQTALTANGLVDVRAAKSRPILAAPQEQERLRPGDLLLKRVHANVKGIGQAAMVPDLLTAPLLCESSMMRLRVRRSMLPPEILLAWLHHPPVRDIIVAKAHGSIQVCINHQVLETLPCPFIPDPEEREWICAKLAELTHAVQAAYERLASVTASARAGRR